MSVKSPELAFHQLSLLEAQVLFTVFARQPGVGFSDPERRACADELIQKGWLDCTLAIGYFLTETAHQMVTALRDDKSPLRMGDWVICISGSSLMPLGIQGLVVTQPAAFPEPRESVDPDDWAQITIKEPHHHSILTRTVYWRRIERPGADWIVTPIAVQSTGDSQLDALTRERDQLARDLAQQTTIINDLLDRVGVEFFDAPVTRRVEQLCLAIRDVDDANRRLTRERDSLSGTLKSIGKLAAGFAAVTPDGEGA